MTIRLAFSVAAHLEPEIMIVDEVLAVGDAIFQKKCLGKMNEVAGGGRTILFVSHDINAINSLCTRALLLHQGKVLLDGSTKTVTEYYLDRANRLYSPVNWIDTQENKDEILIKEILVEQTGKATTAIDCRSAFRLTVDFEKRAQLKNARLFLIIRNAKGEILFTTSDHDTEASVRSELAGVYQSKICVPAGLFKVGSYFITAGADIKNERVICAADDVAHFDVYDSQDDPLAERHTRPGVMAPLLTWKTEVASDASSNENLARR
jgi:lipopolysaccharide transport system ATP-binding protein